MDRAESIRKLLKIKLQKAHRFFYEYCKLREPEYYTDDKPHLKTLCDTLQAFHEGQIMRIDERFARDKTPYTLEKNFGWHVYPKGFVPDMTYEFCNRLQINMPPRFGKSRTLVNFETWVLGNDKFKKFIMGGYNDKMAFDFSRYVRDTISEKKTKISHMVFSDIFPGIRIKQNDASLERWALEDCFLTYVGTGPNGSSTGKGADYLVIDDPIKDDRCAFNDGYMDTIWSWIVGTLWQRLEKRAMVILNMTRWPNADPCERIELNPEIASSWYRLIFRAKKDDGTMLCSAIIDEADYVSKRKTIPAVIFEANYQQRVFKAKGRLYPKFQKYSQLVTDEEGKILSEGRIAYVDTADQGTDYLCAIAANQWNNCGYVTGVYYTQEPQEVTERETAKFLIDNETKFCLIESNNGGRAFARNVDRILKEEFKRTDIIIDWFHQGENKKARIWTNAVNVTKQLYFPEGFELTFGEYYYDMAAMMKDGVPKYLDGPDATTGLVEMVNGQGVLLYV